MKTNKPVDPVKSMCKTLTNTNKPVDPVKSICKTRV